MTFDTKTQSKTRPSDSQEKTGSFKNSHGTFLSGSSSAAIRRRQVVQQIFRSGYIQANLAIRSPNDPDEREADTVACTIMRKAAGAACWSPESEEKCEECKLNQSGPSIQAAPLLFPILRMYQTLATSSAFAAIRSMLPHALFSSRASAATSVMSTPHWSTSCRLRSVPPSPGLRRRL